MRILVSGNGANVLGNYLQNEVVEPLRFLGHEVLVTELTETKLKKTLHKFSPDILVVIPSNKGITGARIRALTAESETVAICLHAGCRYSGTSTSLHDLEEDLREYDLVFVPEEHVYEEYKNIGGYRLSLLKPSVHPPSLVPAVVSERRGIVCVGDADPINVEMMLALQGIEEVTVLGEGWENLPLDINYEVSLPIAERGTLFAGAKIVVELAPSLTQQSVTRRSHSEMGISSFVLEAAVVCTASVVFERPGIAEHFDIENDVFVYRGNDDLGQLLPMLLASSNDVEIVAHNAWHRVHSDHTWSQRWQSILEPWLPRYESDPEEDVLKMKARQSVAVN
ncbi:MAG: glycosyltransferase [Actinomycetota bacterium]|jgi:hypothetical protein|nr:glycosyltransferase [Acidimicrobiales bacterium]